MTSYRKLITTKRRSNARPLLDRAPAALILKKAICIVKALEHILMEGAAVLTAGKVGLTLEEAVSKFSSLITWEVI